MPRWSYKLVPFDLHADDPEVLSAYQDLLDYWGGEGWEAVNMVQPFQGRWTEGQEKLVVLFKKERK